MFISVLELFKIGIGPSSSHTVGPLVAASDFLHRIERYLTSHSLDEQAAPRLRCTLKGSLAFTGKGHATDKAVILGLHGYSPEQLAQLEVDVLLDELKQTTHITLPGAVAVRFCAEHDIVFDVIDTLPQHPNGMVLELLDKNEQCILTETYFSIGGGFINTLAEIEQRVPPLKMQPAHYCPYPFDSASSMLSMSRENSLSIAAMKQQNETSRHSHDHLFHGMNMIWQAMQTCIEQGLQADGFLPGGLNVKRRARQLYQQLQDKPANANLNDWLCVYAMAVNEENAAGHMVVTAPTNGAAGVIPAVLFYFMQHEAGSPSQVYDFLLTAAAIGGLIKHRSSISGAEVGCQGEVGSAAAMAAAGLCAVRGGTAQQIENAAEIALEHHLGMTCDPVNGLVQVPCIERNGFGAIKAYTAASLALRGSGEHFMPLDNCIAAMEQTGREMSAKFKETAQGGLAVSFTEC